MLFMLFLTVHTNMRSAMQLTYIQKNMPLVYGHFDFINGLAQGTHELEADTNLRLQESLILFFAKSS